MNTDYTDKNDQDPNRFDLNLIDLFDFNFTETEDFSSHSVNWTEWTEAVLLGVICVIGLLGNVFTVYTIARLKFQFNSLSKIDRGTLIYIFNIAIADILSLLGIPLHISYLGLNYWPFGDYICKVFIVSMEITRVVSPLFLVILSVDRCVALCNAGKRQRRYNPVVGVAFSVTAWICSLCLLLPYGLYSNELEPIGHNDGAVCTTSWPDYSIFQFFTVSSFLWFCLSLLIVFGFNAAIMCGSCSRATSGHSNRYSVHQSTTTSNDNGTNHIYIDTFQPVRYMEIKSNRQFTNLVVLVTILYYLCLLPLWIFQISLEFDLLDVPPVAVVFANCLAHFNSAVNPILCIFLCDYFKIYFLDSLRCDCGKVDGYIAGDNEENVSMIEIKGPRRAL